MAKKRNLTKTGRYFEQATPLAVRPFIPPSTSPKPGRLPFIRLHKMGPTEKLDLSGSDIAALIAPSLTANPVFFLDTSIFSSCTAKELWDLFLSYKI